MKINKENNDKGYTEKISLNSLATLFTFMCKIKNLF